MEVGSSEDMVGCCSWRVVELFGLWQRASGSSLRKGEDQLGGDEEKEKKRRRRMKVFKLRPVNRVNAMCLLRLLMGMQLSTVNDSLTSPAEL